MGCGQSKINLYPRRSKHSGKGAKKSAAADKDTDEEEGSTADTAPEEPDEEPDSSQHVLPISDHQPAFEVSASQQDFFKMLDEKIEQGKDFDSSSETEIECEHERRRMLIEQWRSISQSTHSSLSQPSPPMTGNRHLTRSISKVSERQNAPSTSVQCHRRESPPTRRMHCAQNHEPRPSTSDWDPNKSPVKRATSGASYWKGNPKVAPFPKPKDRKEDSVAGCSKDSQITYNPTFEHNSPAHAKAQPYKAQITSCPLSQQVTPPSPSKFIAPPAEYQDPGTVDRQVTVAQINTQSQIYYIQGSNSNVSPDIVQQRQQTAIHLQQFVAMKQAQQQMFTSYMQRTPQAVFPTVEYPNQPRMYEGEELAAQYGHPGLRPQSAPNRFSIADVTHMPTPMWSPLPPVMTGPWAGGQVPPEMQYYPQSQFVPMFRANSAGSAGTLTRYAKKDDAEKSVSISVVRGKPVGQIVAVGGQELAVSSTVSDSPSPASVSTDSGVSPGTSAPSSKSSFSTTPPTTSANETFDPKPKPKNKKTKGRILKVSKSLESN